MRGGGVGCSEVGLGGWVVVGGFGWIEGFDKMGMRVRDCRERRERFL